MNFKFGIIGCGKMMGAILSNIYSNGICQIKPSDICIFDINTGGLGKYENEGFTIMHTSNDVIKSSMVVFLGIKPQNFLTILNDSNMTSFAETLHLKAVVSIMAGIQSQNIKSQLPNDVDVIRVMPNMPCAVQKGAIAVNFNNCSNDIKVLVSEFLSCSGEIIEVAEDDFDAVTSISGSGPAYVYSFVDAMVKSGINGGLSPEVAKKLAIKTVEGAIALASSSEDDFERLIDNVACKGGTTIEAIETFKNEGFYEIIDLGIRRCREKSKLLSQNLL